MTKRIKSDSIIRVEKTVQKISAVAPLLTDYGKTMEEIKYRLVRSNRRTLVIEIGSDGEVVVRAPARAPTARIEDFIRAKKTGFSGLSNVRIGNLGLSVFPFRTVAE